MTYADWLAFRPDPDVLLRFLINSDAPRIADVETFPDCRASERKLRLFACACYHRLADLLPNPLARRAVEVAERFADGDADEAELGAIEAEVFAAYDQQEGPWRAARGADRARLAADHHALALALQVVRRPAPHAAWYASSNAYLAAPELLHPRAGVHDAVRGKAERAEKTAQVAILRCQFGPPLFAAQSLDLDAATTNVVAVARQAYRDRGWRALPVLADALEDAGRTDADVLGHLRGPGPHVRGCWVVDLVLGKE